MQTFTGFIDDDRYSIPTVMFFMAQGEGQARRFACQNLAANPHHKAFEVRTPHDVLLFIARREVA
jgi:hypothetical protein